MAHAGQVVIRHREVVKIAGGPEGGIKGGVLLAIPVKGVAFGHVDLAIEAVDVGQHGHFVGRPGLRREQRGQSIVSCFSSR